MHLSVVQQRTKIPGELGARGNLSHGRRERYECHGPILKNTLSRIHGAIFAPTALTFRFNSICYIRVILPSAVEKGTLTDLHHDVFAVLLLHEELHQHVDDPPHVVGVHCNLPPTIAIERNQTTFHKFSPTCPCSPCVTSEYRN